MMICMTDEMAIVQTRVPVRDVDQLDDDLTELGLASRSEGLREGLRLVHHRAEQAALARDYDEFYGEQGAPLSEVAAVGDHVAAETMAEADTVE